MIHDYGKIGNFDDVRVSRQFAGLHVEIEEKVDGSQFSAALLDGVVHMRSKGQSIDPLAPGMFSKAVESVAGMRLEPGLVYRFEYLSKPKHNTLAYGRVPAGNLVLFDVHTTSMEHWSSSRLPEIAADIGVEHTQLLYSGPLPARPDIDKLLDRESFLGGCKIEGVVIKARDERDDRDGKMLKAKVVSSEFRERHQKAWRESNPTTGDIVDQIADELSTEARFRKAVQSARDAGALVGGYEDIGHLMRRLAEDFHGEHAEYVRERLYNHFWNKIMRRANRAFPEWYKKHLTECVA